MRVFHICSWRGDKQVESKATSRFGVEWPSVRIFGGVTQEKRVAIVENQVQGSLGGSYESISLSIIRYLFWGSGASMLLPSRFQRRFHPVNYFRSTTRLWNYHHRRCLNLAVSNSRVGLCEKDTKFVFRIKHERYIQQEESDYTHLYDLGLLPGTSFYLIGVKVTKQTWFWYIRCGGLWAP